MRLNLLISNTGTIVNPDQNEFIKASPINGNATSSLFSNQVTLEFYNDIVMQPNGIFTPDMTSVIKTGLSGTVQVKVWPSANAPYPVDLSPSDSIDISQYCILQWTGLTEALDIICTDVVGANYINVLFDRM